MDKSIQKLFEKLGSQNNSLGFISIKGGSNSLPQVGNNNGTCDNTKKCSGTNSDVCTNYDCPDATNSKPAGCTNSHTCFV